MIHLTETGFNAGRPLCGVSREEADEKVHAVYAPLERPAFRAKACTDCLRVWALEAYDNDDTMPEWVQEMRSFANGI